MSLQGAWTICTGEFIYFSYFVVDASLFTFILSADTLKFRMVASISDQTVSRRDRDMSVASDSSGRFPGTRPILITNDQMRDHKLELLEPRLFRRWYGCHIVNYNFTAFVMDESVAGNEIRFAQADFFSREVQGNIRPTAEAGKWTGVAWHFPVSDWDLDERFVICIPRAKPESL